MQVKWDEWGFIHVAASTQCWVLKLAVIALFGFCIAVDFAKLAVYWWRMLLKNRALWFAVVFKLSYHILYFL